MTHDCEDCEHYFLEMVDAEGQIENLEHDLSEAESQIDVLEPTVDELRDEVDRLLKIEELYNELMAHLEYSHPEALEDL